jgi:zinc transport system permease protein
MLEYEFMQRAFLAGILIAILASVSGTFIVLRRYSMIGETLAHSSLVGVAVALVANSNPIWVSVIFALIASWIIEFLRQKYELYADSVLSILLSGSLALAVVIVSIGGSFNSSLFSYLFGSILAVSDSDVYTILIVGGISLVVLFLNANKLYFIAYDEEVAKVSGIKVKSLNFLLVSIVAIIISLSIQIVGSLLIGALMVIPVISALQFRVGFLKTILLGIFFSVFSVVSGMSLSYYFSLPSGATIVLFVILLFVISLLINGKK